MQYARLGNSGLKTSRIIFGGMSFGDKNWQPWICGEEEGLPVLKYAFDRGINTWDVADTYSNGESERIIGKAIKKYDIPRSKLVIMTKCCMYVDEAGGPVDPSRSVTNDGDMVNLVGLSRKPIFDAVDSSIERLGTYIDVLQIHRLDRDVSLEEIMKALNDVVESGKVRYIGASTDPFHRSKSDITTLIFPFCCSPSLRMLCSWPWSRITLMTHQFWASISEVMRLARAPEPPNKMTRRAAILR